MLKKNEPDWIEHDGSDVCPVPAGHDVEVEYNWGKTYRCDNPELRDWTRITHYRDWTAFEQQQASAGEVPKLLTPEQAARISELREPELILGALTLAGLIAPEPEPVDPFADLANEIIALLGDTPMHQHTAAVAALLRARGVTAPARGE